MNIVLNAAYWYNPFGKQDSVVVYGTGGHRFTYNDKELDDELGFEMYYYGARFYDPSLGRFSSPDPVKDYHNPYSYVRNNPIRYIDPTGTNTWGVDFDPELTWGGFIGPSGFWDVFDPFVVQISLHDYRVALGKAANANKSKDYTNLTDEQKDDIKQAVSDMKEDSRYGKDPEFTANVDLWDDFVKSDFTKFDGQNAAIICTNKTPEGIEVRSAMWKEPSDVIVIAVNPDLFKLSSGALGMQLLHESFEYRNYAKKSDFSRDAHLGYDRSPAADKIYQFQGEYYARWLGRNGVAHGKDLSWGNLKSTISRFEYDYLFSGQGPWDHYSLTGWTRAHNWIPK